MGKVIWKSPLQIVDRQAVLLPMFSVILCAREQGENICIWYECDPTLPKFGREIVIRATGHPYEDLEPLRYLGTASLAGGNLIYHVYEKPVVQQ